ncbi:hypothetical protein GCM10010149_14820 [Nonomuraea roseoviolacea subsp. roseoviolacea]|uniref:SH3 domain-containing protein n=1 Tax=Nonomuraea roseoviolacea subsp. carminata TaxID=160689 RepID=A0ABT1KBN6_9ACTN|nr:hypothetical protein [Nonomuraea roseoviolacea]MCP2351423.1 hypothetical protein [Nonomuraea roseoviolacea subsp. carminata]
MQSKWFLALPLTVLAAGACLTTTAMASQTSAPVAAAARPSALPPGYQLVTLPNANVPNFQRRTLYCPGSKKVLGGGAEARGNRAILVGSFPTDDGHGWIALGRQDGYSDVGISVFAICAD